MRRIFIAAILTMVACNAAFARSPNPSGAGAGRHVGPTAHARQGAYPAGAYAAEPGFVDPSRAKALRECTVVEQKASPSITQSNMPFLQYRKCMYDHGQPE